MFKASKILKPELIDVDFMINVLPPNLSVSKAQLLYSHTQELKDAKKEFERW